MAEGLNTYTVAILKNIWKNDLNGRRFAEVEQEAGAKHGFSSVLVGVALLSVIHTWTCNSTAQTIVIIASDQMKNAKMLSPLLSSEAVWQHPLVPQMVA